MKPESIEVCLLYNHSTGHIAHIHRVATFAGAKKTSKTEMEKQCAEVAKKLGHATTKLKYLHVDHSVFKSGHVYKVDVKKKKLVGRPAAAR